MDEWEKEGQTFYSKIVKRGDKSKAIPIAKSIADVLKLKIGQPIKIMVFRFVKGIK